MKKTKKSQEKSENRIRVVTYLGRELVDWLATESRKTGLDASVYIRHALTKIKQDQISS